MSTFGPGEADYPAWVCRECAARAGVSRLHEVTFHEGNCEVCSRTAVPVSLPRNMNWPEFYRGLPPYRGHVPIRVEYPVLAYRNPLRANFS